MKKILIMLFMLLVLSGCQEKTLPINKEVENNEVKENISVPEGNLSQEESKDEEEITYFTLNPGNYGDITKMHNGFSLDSLILNEDGSVDSSSCAAEGGCSSYYGTYTVSENKLICTYDRYQMLEIEYLPEVVVETFTITGNNVFVSEDGVEYTKIK